MPDLAGRDQSEVARTLSRWLSTKLPQDAEPEVNELHAPASTGFSNETILCRATWGSAADRRERRLVIRVAPTRHHLFLDAEFSGQYRVMKALADAGTPVPLPELGWYEGDAKWLGVPFFTMAHVDGSVPPDNLPYTMEGWVLEASPGEQERMWWSGLEAMAAIHRTDWQRIGLGWLANRSGHLRPGLDHQLDYYRRFFDWSSRGRPQPVIEAAWKWLLEHRPTDSVDVGLCWGDSRIGNIIWSDFRPAAVIDWEMATIGPAELDLGWWLYFDRQFSEGLSVPRPAGFPSHQATIERYADLIGRQMSDIEYYEIFSGFRFSIIMCRLVDLLIESGQLPPDSDMGTNNLATQFTARLLNLPLPAG